MDGVFEFEHAGELAIWVETKTASSSVILTKLHNVMKACCTAAALLQTIWEM